RMVEALMPAVRGRVATLNEAHFKAQVKRVSIRDNSSRWGSCSRDGSISLNMRLLFMPEAILDYVIVHELAHTRYRGHGPRFWALVGSVMPDHIERRRWLKENGWAVPATDIPHRKGQQTLTDFAEEPY
ncbi:MAG: M48 family metallopeptidase, partial [Candidatus Micrarchaeota archaeon]